VWFDGVYALKLRGIDAYGVLNILAERLKDGRFDLGRSEHQMLWLNRESHSEGREAEKTNTWTGRCWRRGLRRRASG